MATSIGGAAARGLESGFDLGLRSDTLAEAKRSRRAQEDFQRQSQERADAAEARQTARDQQTFALKASHDELGRLQGMAADFHAAGKAIPDDFARQYQQVYGAHRTMIDAALQPYVNKASQLAVGQLDMGEMSPTDIYRTVTAATRLTPQQMEQVTQGVSEVHAGMETGNQPLLLQGANKVMAKSLNQGLGALAPNGRPIVRKELIALTPARGADGRDYPDMVIPLLRVHTDDGGYYDAPMTQNRSTDPNDMVKAIPIKALMDGLGNMGTLTAALQNPQVAEKYKEGAATSQDWTAAALGVAGATARAKMGGPLMQRLALIDSRRASGEIDPETADTMTKAALGIKPTTAVDEARVKVLEERAKVIPQDSATKARAVDVRADAIKARIAKAAGVAVPSAGTLSAKYDTNEDYRTQVDFWSKLLANGGKLPPRFAQSGAGKEMFSDIVQRVPALSGGVNDMIANQAEVGGAMAGSRAVGTRAANFGLAKSEAYEMADLVTETSAQVSRTSFMPINKAIVAFEKNTGDMAVRQFGASINSFINAYARAVSPIGTPTVSDKDHAREMLSTADSHQQIVGIIAQLKKEMIAAGNAPAVVRREQREAVMGMGSGVPAPAAAPIAQPAGARTATNPATGERLMLKDGQWVPLK